MFALTFLAFARRRNIRQNPPSLPNVEIDHEEIFENDTIIEDLNNYQLQGDPFPGRQSGDIYKKIDPKTEKFPQGGQEEQRNCPLKIYNQTIKRYTLKPPYLYTMYDHGYFSAFKFNRCYFTPYHTHRCNKWGDFPHSYKIQYDKKNSKYRLILYQDGTGRGASEAGDVGCKGPVVSTTNWMTLEEFNKKYVQIGFFINESPLKLATENLDYAAYTTFNSENSNCNERNYGERLYYKYDIYWSFNAEQDGWYLVQYKIVQNDPEAAPILGRFDQYWGLEGASQLQNSWCLDGDLTCGACYKNEYVQCGQNYVFPK